MCIQMPYSLTLATAATPQDNEMVIILEWAEAGDLGQLLKQRAQEGQFFEPAHIWQLFYQVCSAMKHMHDRRMMHRDLKPGNIFVASDGSLKLGDLGLSRYFSSRTLQALTTGVRSAGRHVVLKRYDL